MDLGARSHGIDFNSLISSHIPGPAYADLFMGAGGGVGAPYLRHGSFRHRDVLGSFPGAPPPRQSKDGVRTCLASRRSGALGEIGYSN